MKRTQIAVLALGLVRHWAYWRDVGRPIHMVKKEL